MYIECINFNDIEYDFTDELSKVRPFTLIPAYIDCRFKRFFESLVAFADANKDINYIFLPEFRSCGSSWQFYYNYILDCAVEHDVLIIENIDLHLDLRKTIELIRHIKGLNKKVQVICSTYNTEVVGLFYRSDRLTIPYAKSK